MISLASYWLIYCIQEAGAVVSEVRFGIADTT